MTERKHLKARVRARMEKTGERYASARAHVVGPPSTERGRVAECAALRGALPSTKLSEATLFGIGGGIGFGYWMFEYKQLPAPLVSIFTRHAWDSGKRFLLGTCERLGIEPTVHETTSAALAQRQLDQALNEGAAPLVWLAGGEPSDELAAMTPRVVLVRERSGDGYAIEDRGVSSHVDAAELARMRALVKTEKHRLMRVEQPPSKRLDEAMQSGIAACVAEMRAAAPHLPKMVAPNNGLAGLRKWAEQLGDLRGRQGWSRRFGSDEQLRDGLAATYRWIETNGAGGLRPLYADFLHQVGRDDAAKSYVVLGQHWSALGDALRRDIGDREDLLKDVSTRVAEIAELEAEALDKLEGAH